MSQIKKTGSLTPKQHKLAAETRRRFEAKRSALKDQLLALHVREAAVDQVHTQRVQESHNTRGVGMTLAEQLRFLSQKTHIRKVEGQVEAQLSLIDKAIRVN